MIWADRVALGLVAIFLVILGFTVALGLLRPELFRPTPENIGYGIGLVLGGAVFVTLPLWLLLRILDWVAGGPGRRRQGAQSVVRPKRTAR